MMAHVGEFFSRRHSRDDGYAVIDLAAVGGDDFRSEFLRHINCKGRLAGGSRPCDDYYGRFIQVSNGRIIIQRLCGRC